MDCFFNKIIPNSTKNIIIIPPISKTFINGIASKYNDSYPIELSNLIGKELYFRCIFDINSYLATYWPCTPAFLIGYFFSCCTCGCSFYLPYLCIYDAENAINNLIQQQNNNVFHSRGLEISLKKKCSTSWLQIEKVNPSEIELESVLRKELPEENNLL